MKLCIYLKKNEPEVTFSSEEHIFPAAIGGRRKLPKEYVSAECNNTFSSMELAVMRYSLISMPRQFYGPGKRGSLNPKYATTSEISIMNGKDDPNTFELGYISLGMPYNIPQVKVKVKVKVDVQYLTDTSHGDTHTQLSDFARNLESFNPRSIKIIKNNLLNKDEFLLGFHKNKWYVGLSDEELMPRVHEFVQKNIAQTPFNEKQIHHSITEQPRVHQHIQMDDKYFRVCAKTIFNCLASLRGQDFVLHDRFDPLRNWIVNGGDDSFAELIGSENEIFPLSLFPEQSHVLTIRKTDSILYGIISFYGNHFPTLVRLCDNFDEPFEDEVFICDWKKTKWDYTLREYLMHLHEENEKKS